MAGPTDRRTPQSQANQVAFFLFYSLAFTANARSHRPTTYQWEVTRTIDGTIVKNYTTSGYPVIEFDLCDLLGRDWNKPDPSSAWGRSGAQTYGCGTESLEQGLWHSPHYLCPREGPSECGAKDDYYCAAWDCVTLAPWTTTDQHLRFTRTLRTGAPSQDGTCGIGNCNPVRLEIITWRASYWEGGKTWGLRLYVTGRDPGILLTIRKRPIPHQENPNPRGPLQPIFPPGPLRPAHRTPIEKTLCPSRTGETKVKEGNTPPREPGLFDTLDAMFQFLNKSSPGLTQDCWLCLNPEPPYYIGTAANRTVGNGDRDIQNISLTDDPCRWGSPPKLSLDGLQGSGTCLLPANYPLEKSPYSTVCSSTITLPGSPGQGEAVLLAAPEGTWWACTNGVTPCVFPPAIMDNEKPGLCVLTHILPQVYYFSGEGGREHLGLEPRRHKRAPDLFPLIGSLETAESAAVRALVKGQNYKELGQRVDIDLRTREGTVSKLEGSLSSLAEVVPQNRRGLHLQGGLCQALGETCYFYKDNSEVIRENLSKLRKRLEERERARQRNWYEGPPPWLIGTAVGLLVLLLLALAGWPYLLKSKVQLVLQTPCQHLPQDEGEIQDGSKI